VWAVYSDGTKKISVDSRLVFRCNKQSRGVITMEESDRRYNQMVDLVNHNRPKSELVPPIQNKEEDEKFDMLVYELSNLRRKYPKAMLAHIDSEWGANRPRL